jgi:protein-S-isoprenylcysteine O-methyltransferase Ste14
MSTRVWKYVLEFYGTLLVPVVYLVGLMLVARGEQAELVSGLRLIGLGAALAGIGLWIASYVSLGRHFGVLPRRQVTTHRGVYRDRKHPMYLAILATYIGLSVANASVSGLVYSVFFLAPLLWVRARLEERQLTE